MLVVAAATVCSFPIPPAPERPPCFRPLQHPKLHSERVLARIEFYLLRLFDPYVAEFSLLCFFSSSPACFHHLPRQPRNIKYPIASLAFRAKTFPLSLTLCSISLPCACLGACVIFEA